MWKLVIQDDEGKTTVVPLIRDEITIGRKEGNTIRLTERNVSRRHARIHRANGAVTIEDLNSYNGVLLNGTRVQGKASLAESDRVQIGDYLIELKSDSQASAGDAKSPPEETAPETQPMDRVDPMGNTPVPAPIPQSDSHAATRPVQATAATAPLAAVTPPAAAPPAAAPSVTGVAVGAAATPPSLADTDPGQKAVDAAAKARLVVLSSNFAGAEYELTRPASVIGRTDDNDIIVNHRSISRHHAKVVHEDERYWIVDLGSSNGVRVNGEEYGKVELRKGDVVDLGHVRFRFVEAGEDFVLGRDAQIVDLAAEGATGSRGVLWAMLALLVIGGAAAVYAMTRGEPTTAPAVAGDAIEPAPRETPAPTPTPDEPPEPVDDLDMPAPGSEPEPGTEPSATGGGLVDKLTLARDARDDERWADMQGAAIEALAIDPANADARRLKEQAERELENRTRFDRFQEAVAKRDYGKIHNAFREMDATSVYRLRAQPQHDKVMAQYVDSVADRAAAMAQRGKCRDLKGLVARAGAIYREAGSAAQGFVNECERNQQARAPDRRDPTPTPPRPEKPVAELVAEAKDAAKGGNYGLAFRLCEQALEQRPSDAEARTVCVIAACNMDREKAAQRHYARLSESRKRGIYQLCASRGIKLD